MKILKLTLLLLCICAGSKLRAQEDYAMYENRTFYGGVIAGVNLAQIDGDNFAGYGRKGMNVGGAIFFKMDEHIAGSIEVLIAQKGSRSKEPQLLSAGYVITKYGADLTYGEIPVTINYFDDHKNHFGGGLSYSRLGTSNEYISTNQTPSIPIDQARYPFKKSDFQILLGGSAHLYKGLFLNLRFQYSLLSIRNNVPNITRAAQYNNVWTIRFMYLFL